MSVSDRRARLRDDLVAAAEARIVEGGLAALKARDLAREVGCALGAIYNVFPDLDALILAANGRTLSEFEAHLDATLPSAGEGDPVDELVGLACAYLDFALAHRRRWQALFQHRLPEGSAIPDWYMAQQAELFARVEKPVARLRPDLDGEACALLGRSVFSATHGVVALGLDEKLASLPPNTLRAQLEILVRAIGRGLARA